MIILKPFDVLIDAEQTNPQNVHDFFQSFIMLTRWGSPAPPRELARAQKKREPT